jgi:hypothetical protein
MLLIYLSAYLLIGFFWVEYAHDKMVENAKGRPFRIFITWALNYFLWLLCMAVFIYNKIKGKKVLFENEITYERDPLNGDIFKHEYSRKGLLVFKQSEKYWAKYKYDKNGNIIRFEDSRTGLEKCN